MTLCEFRSWCRADATRYEIALQMEEILAIHEEKLGVAMDLEDRVRHVIVLVINELIAVDDDEPSSAAMDLSDELVIAHMHPAVIMWAELDMRPGFGPYRPVRAVIQVVDAVLERTWIALDAITTGRRPPTRADYPEYWRHL